MQVGEPEVGKRVTWAELFFDLVFVVAVTRVSGLLEHHLSWGGALRTLVVFVPIYWLWVGTSIQTNLQDATRPLLRIRIFGVALAGVFMALSVPEAYGHLGLLYALAYWLGRLVLGVGIVRDALRRATSPSGSDCSCSSHWASRWCRSARRPIRTTSPQRGASPSQRRSCSAAACG